VTGILDRLVDELAELDNAIRAAGREHLAGNPQRALELLDDAAIHLADVRADLRRELDEPDPQP